MMADQRKTTSLLILGFFVLVLFGSWGLIWLIVKPGPLAVWLSLAVFAGFYWILLTKLSDAHLKYAFLIPSILIFCIILVIPIAYLIYLSFFRVTMLNFRFEWPFAGLSNYISMIRDDRQFFPSLVRSVELLIAGLTLQFILGFGIALLLNRKLPFEALLTSLIILPIMTNSIVVGMLWKQILGYYNGLFNLILGKLGIEGVPWLTPQPLAFIRSIPFMGRYLNANYAFLSIILVNTWQWTPFMFLLLRAALRSLPTAPFEAAQIDGASAWQTFWHITLPLLRNTMEVVLIVRAIDILKTFGQIWALFGNATVTRTLPIHIYTVGITEQNYSRGSVLSLMLALLSIVVYFVFRRIFAWRKAAA